MIAIIAINRPLNKVLITWWVNVSLAAGCVTRVAVYSSTHIQKKTSGGNKTGHWSRVAVDFR